MNHYTGLSNGGLLSSGMSYLANNQACDLSIIANKYVHSDIYKHVSISSKSSFTFILVSD